MTLLPQVLPWYVVGSLIGLVVSGMYAITNQPIGASGSYAQITDKILGKVMKESWRLFFMTGVIIGGGLAAWLSGHLSFSLAYGTLGNKISPMELFVLLFTGGLLMGYGARWMGGCTSGMACAVQPSDPPAVTSLRLHFRNCSGSHLSHSYLDVV